MAAVTQLPDAAAAGDPRAAAELLPLVYDELRKPAAARMAEEKATTPSSPPPWFTRPTSASWVGASGRGTHAATSSPPPRPCAASWWKPPAARNASSTAAGDGDSQPAPGG